MGDARRPGRRRWLDASLHPTRQDGAIAAALFLLPWAWLLILARHPHPDIFATVAILVAASVGTSTLWITWAGYRGPRRPGISAHDGSVNVVGGGEQAEGPLPGPAVLPIWLSQEADVEVKLGRLPREGVRGREDVLSWLQGRLGTGGLVVLVGTGGMGKSTIAREFAHRLPMKYKPPVWEVSGAGANNGDTSLKGRRSGGRSRRSSDSTSASFIGGLIGVARRLGAAQEDLHVIGIEAPSGPSRLWALLNRGPKGWLLIIDDADDTEILAAPAVPGYDSPTLAEGNGWVRVSRRGLVLVTSRQHDKNFWPNHTVFYELAKLSDYEAGKILRDLAPDAGNEAEAEALASRLGGLPLVLRLVGRYLRYAEEETSFEDYRQDLDLDLVQAIRHLEPDRDDPDAARERLIMTRTWELSLDALARDGLPSARPLLRLLSCYAAALPIPLGLLEGEFLTKFLSASVNQSNYSESEGESVNGLLRGLERLGLVERSRLFSREAESSIDSAGTRPGVLSPSVGIIVHRAIADANRYHLLQSEHSHLLACQAAVDILAAALDALVDDRPADWPAFRVLTPHLQALLSNSAVMLDDDYLDILIRVTGHTATAYGQFRASAFGIELIKSALLHIAAKGERVTSAILIMRQRLAMLHGQIGQNVQAEDIYREILEAQLRLWRFDDPAILAIRHNLAESVGAQGDTRWADADTNFRSLLEDEQRALGQSDPITLATRRAYATFLYWQGHWAKAVAVLEDLLSDQQRVFGKDHRTNLVTRFNLVQAQRHLKGHQSQAEDALRELLQDARRLLGDEHAITIAISQSDETVLIRKSLLGTPALREERARALIEKGRLLLEEGDRDGAARAYQQVVDWFAGDSAPVLRTLVAWAWLRLSACHSSSGSQDRAREAAEQAVALYDVLARVHPRTFDEELAAARQQLARTNNDR